LLIASRTVGTSCRAEPDPHVAAASSAKKFDEKTRSRSFQQTTPPHAAQGLHKRIGSKRELFGSRFESALGRSYALSWLFAGASVLASRFLLLRRRTMTGDRKNGFSSRHPRSTFR